MDVLIYGYYYEWRYELMRKYRKKPIVVEAYQTDKEIDAIAYGMVDFIRDNPEIVDKIKNGERLSI